MPYVCGDHTWLVSRHVTETYLETKWQMKNGRRTSWPIKAGFHQRHQHKHQHKIHVLTSGIGTSIKYVTWLSHKHEYLGHILSGDTSDTATSKRRNKGLISYSYACGASEDGSVGMLCFDIFMLMLMSLVKIGLCRVSRGFETWINVILFEVLEKTGIKLGTQSCALTTRPWCLREHLKLNWPQSFVSHCVEDLILYTSGDSLGNAHILYYVNYVL